jgi:hypothetical protein
MDGKSEGKRPLVKSRYRWEDNIRMNFREIMLEVDIKAVNELEIMDTVYGNID